MKLPKFLGGGDDRELAATKYQGRESATESAARSRRAGHKARVIRDGDASGTKVPRHLRRHNGG